MWKCFKAQRTGFLGCEDIGNMVPSRKEVIRIPYLLWNINNVEGSRTASIYLGSEHREKLEFL